MHIFSNGLANTNDVQPKQNFGAAVPRNSFTNQQQSFNGGFQQLPFPQFLLQNLIQQIVSQLLQSLLNQNSNQATPFNDILRGGDDAELIQGIGGNDQLFGNGGDDILRGGDGHDYLNGGQGNDSLFGGAGNDLLQDDSGRNHFVGGEGYDTLRLNGAFSDYTIKKNYINSTQDQVGNTGTAPDERPYNGFVVTNNATGDFNTVESVENFQFSNGSITADQLIQHIDANQNTNQNIVLTGDQDSAIRDRFDIGNGSNYQVLDVDNNQSLSAGDILEVLVGGDALSTITLTDDDIAAINGNPLPAELNLTQAQHDAIGARFNQLPPPNSADFPTTTYEGIAIDQNGDGNLSEGDIVKLRTTGGLAGVNIVEDHMLTAEDIAAIEQDRSDPILDISNGLSNEQKSGLYNAIYGDVAFTSAPSIQSVFDRNSDNKLSEGDIVTISQFDETTGATNLSFHALTQENIATLLSNSNNTALDKLLENQQKWEDSGIESSGYSFRLERSAFAPAEAIRPTISNVLPNGGVNDVFADTLVPVPDNYNQANATIDKLFDIIKSAIDSGADNVDVQYDAISGHPTSIFIDYNEQIADEELRLNISNLQASDIVA